MDRFVWFGVAAAALVAIFLVWALQGGRYPAGEHPEYADETAAALARTLPSPNPRLKEL